MTWRGILGVLIFAAFVAFIEVYLGWGALLAPWAALPPAALVAAALLTLASYGLRALRFYDYFAADMSGRGGACVKLMLQHNLWNNLLPMRTGEFSFPWLMSRYFAVPVARSLPALAWFRVLDLHALGLAALAGAAWLDGAGWLAVLAAWLPLPGLLSRAAGLLRRRLGERTGRLAPLLDKLLAGLPRTRRALWRSVLWTYVNWLVKLAAFAWV
ncbi:MAG TPA: UPF0104 family protein, partial [Gammaproteobacteria bacterium]|nr:UPF0104 family protein [Gammaproteobacteria bacterium]